jgi:hypothetical protein
MKKLIFILLYIPLFTIAQNKKVFNVSRVFPKADRIIQFEDAIGAHAQKYHKGDWSWRVFSVETGPDAGGYQVTEGPASWTAFDSRGDLGKAHIEDWSKNVAVHLTERNSNSYSVYVDSLSTTPLNDFTDKILITHVYPKSGYLGQYIDHVKKVKKTWEVGKQNVAVFQTAGAGRSGYALVFRLKDGLKEFEEGYRKPFKERYEAANGVDSWDGYVQNMRTIINDETWTEMLFLHKKLSSF